MSASLLDTGPIVALLDSSEPHHTQVHRFFAHAQPQRFLTTGAVVTEAFYFLADVPGGPARLAAFLDASATEVRDAFAADALFAAARLMSKYRDIPMDFADATLVWLAEQTGTGRVLTLDRRGFSVFRFAKSRRFTLLLEEP